MATPTLNVSHGPPKRNNNMAVRAIEGAQTESHFAQIETLTIFK